MGGAGHDGHMMEADLIAPEPSRAVPGEGVSTVRVRYNQCDPMGVAHHSAYVEWLEHGRTELLRECGVSYAMLERTGVLLAVVRMEIRYLGPARYDDVLRIRTIVSGGGRARIDHAYEIHRVGADGKDDGALIATAGSTLGCLGPDGRPRALPGWLVPPGGVRRGAR